jgi:hypothetical protein
MKTVLVVAATLALSSSAAFAECAGHVSAEAKVDKTITTASVVTTEKQSRLPADADQILLEEQKTTTVTE